MNQPELNHPVSVGLDPVRKRMTQLYRSKMAMASILRHAQSITRKEVLIMKKLNVTGVYALVVLMLVGVMGLLVPTMAAATGGNTEQKADQKALKEGLEETLGMPVLKGDVWQKMTHDSKIAFIWGFGHVVSIEQHLMEKFPELNRDSFVTKVVEGMADIPMETVIARVDEYYQANPQKIESPVTNVIWDLMIKPNIKTGIAGRPLGKINVITKTTK